MDKAVAIIFGASLFANIFLFIPQILRILKTKSSEDLSLITMIGFNIIQASGCLHGYFQKDLALLFGMGASLISGGTLTVVALIFRKRKRKEDET